MLKFGIKHIHLIRPNISNYIIIYYFSSVHSPDEVQMVPIFDVVVVKFIW